MWTARPTVVDRDTPPKVRFAIDSPLEEDGFELWVPPWTGRHAACVVPTQSSPDLADQAALGQYAVARDQLRRTKTATRWQAFRPLQFRN
jgi:hypothetical protein